MSDLYIDFNELREDNRETEKKKELFDSVLKECHKKIKSTNAELKKKHCIFDVPKFIWGKPPFKFTELLLYLQSSLRKNGFYVEIMKAKNKRGIVLFIRWDEEYLSINKYKIERKKNFTDNWIDSNKIR